MFGFLTGLFDTRDFPPRWHCGQWTEAHGWTHIVSDLAIFAAYTAIPLVIAYFVLRRRDVPFPRIFWLFVIFIFACGTTHLIEAIIFWEPIYRFAGLMKGVTAIASWSTVVALVFITPVALRLPGLATLNSQLANEIDERKQTEFALRESQEHLHLALEAGRMGSWEWDLVTQHVHWSPEVELIHGLEPGTFEGTVEAAQALIHSEDRQRVVAEMALPPQYRGELRTEYRIRLPDEQVRWVEARAKVFVREQNEPRRLVGITIDITDRKQAEREREELLESERAARSVAEKASRLKDEFLSVVSHELRTPLSAILGYAQVLRMGPTSPEDLQESLVAIERNCHAQVQIIDDLLDMGRIIAGKIRLDVRPLNLAEVIESAIDTVRPAADARSVRLQTVIDPRTGPVLGDFDRLQQVLWNLLSNAIKFTPKGGRVQISLERVNSHLEINVADTGAGITPEFLPHVFERFHQAELATTRRHGGLGLGLAIVKQLVELHGGSVRAKSPGVDQGSVFTVVLPLQIVDSTDTDRFHPRAEVAPSFQHEMPELSGIRVLVVDDDQDARDIVRRFLQGRGADVVCASNVDEALASFDESAPDVLISDIGMPGRDGYQLIREIRARTNDAGGTVPAVALTAFARTEDRKQALMAGFQFHLAKPVDPGELLAVVDMLTRDTDRPPAST